MIFGRKKPMSVDESDPRTLLVIDRLESVADRIEALAAEMEKQLGIRLGGGDDDRK